MAKLQKSSIENSRIFADQGFTAPQIRDLASAKSETLKRVLAILQVGYKGMCPEDITAARNLIQDLLDRNEREEWKEKMREENPKNIAFIEDYKLEDQADSGSEGEAEVIPLRKGFAIPKPNKSMEKARKKPNLKLVKE